MTDHSRRGPGFRHFVAIALALAIAACVTQSRLQPVTGAPVGQAANQADPGWRALLIAGDTSSPVFNNAVTASQELLVARGMSPSRITALRSGPTHGRPALEVHQIAEGFAELRAHAADGCLVYITSHGARDGLVIWTRSGPVVLQPATLAAWLSQVCGSKPTVAILSGCFSGVYTDTLPRADNLVIFTASRRDRTSFGCSTNGQLNVFDSCLLGTMQQDPTFGDLVGQTRACVAERERVAKVVSSEPQAFVGAALAEVRLSGLPEFPGKATALAAAGPSMEQPASESTSFTVAGGNAHPTGTMPDPCANHRGWQNRNPWDRAACE